MNVATYRTIGTYLNLATGIALLIALGIALYSFIFMVLRWRTPARRRHVIRLVWTAVAIFCLGAIPYTYIFLVYLPAVARQQRADHAAKLAEASVVHVGDAAPDFTVTRADGTRFSLEDARGDVILINFFATWCGPCRLEMPHLEHIWAEKKDNESFRLLGVGREESVESVREFRDKNGFTFPMAADPDCAVYSLFARKFIPRTLIVSPEGIVVYVQVGFDEDDLDELNAVLEAELANVR